MRANSEAKIADATGDGSLASLVEASPKTAASFDDAWLAECANDLSANPARGIVIVGEQQPAWVQSLAFAINQALGNNGATILGVDTGEKPSASISDLAAAITTGAVKTLFILGGNPAYNAPADLDFSGLLKKVPQAVHLGLFEDETAKLCRWHVPAAHYLEAWSDVRAYDGTYSVVQPMILPLWNGISELEILAQLARNHKPQGPELIRETFAQRFEASAEKWNSVLRVGFAPGSEFPEVPLSFNASQALAETKNAKPAADGLELVFLQSSSVDDGRYASNSWLQETPDFETKVTWDNVALVSPATAKKLGIKANNFGPLYKVAEKLGNDIDFDIVADLIEIKSAGSSVVAAAFVAPGHADDSISLALGYGRAGVSALLDGVGFNAYPLRSTEALRFLTGVEVKVDRQDLSTRADPGASQHGGPRSIPRGHARTLRAGSRSSRRPWAWMVTFLRISPSTLTRRSLPRNSGA